jgi:hypothetical protein
MKTNKSTTFYGSITKHESLHRIQSNILENTWVAEANLPYSNYYGRVPHQSKPNSLFLFTKSYYTLEEILRVSEFMKTCFNFKVNLASAILEFNGQEFPAVRIKNFPDYQKLHLLQDCFAQQGLQFADEVHFMTEAKAKITKCFELKEIEESIYIDQIEEDKGYIFVQKRINRKTFDSSIKKLKNNSSCKYFDAVPCGFIIDAKTVDVVRIFSESLNPELLQCLKTEIEKYILVD